ncbi:g10072 [Coccomyxa elongata]
MGPSTSWIAPTVGCVLSICRHFIATGEVLADLKPLPFAASILNCSGWIVYTVLVRNWFFSSSTQLEGLQSYIQSSQ